MYLVALLLNTSEYELYVSLGDRLKSSVFVINLRHFNSDKMFDQGISL